MLPNRIIFYGLNLMRLSLWNLCDRITMATVGQVGQRKEGGYCPGMGPGQYIYLKKNSPPKYETPSLTSGRHTYRYAQALFLRTAHFKEKSPWWGVPANTPADGRLFILNCAQLAFQMDCIGINGFVNTVLNFIRLPKSVVLLMKKERQLAQGRKSAFPISS